MRSDERVVTAAGEMFRVQREHRLVVVGDHTDAGAGVDEVGVLRIRRDVTGLGPAGAIELRRAAAPSRARRTG